MGDKRKKELTRDLRNILNDIECELAEDGYFVVMWAIIRWLDMASSEVTKSLAASCRSFGEDITWEAENSIEWQWNKEKENIAERKKKAKEEDGI